MEICSQTWGNEKAFESFAQIRTVFLLGVPKDGAIQAKVMEEYKKHKDIIQGTFEEVYGVFLLHA